MKKITLFVSLILIFFIYIGFYKVHMSNYYFKGLGEITVVSGNYINIANDTTHSVIQTFLFDVSKGETINLQITGASVLTFVAVYDIFGFKEYKLFEADGWPMETSYSIDTNNSIHFIKEISSNLFEEILFQSLRNTIFDKGGRLKYIGVEVSTKLNGNTEITRDR